MSHNQRSVDASPTKRFFIEMLIKDVDLLYAITDLIDNSVDGAKSLRQNSDFVGLEICIDFDPLRFRIKDNCGGIDVDHARNYAFRFGRPGDAPDVKASVGQFGVGMKRSLFKLGSKFTVHSRAYSSEFLLDVDVEEWRKDDSNWRFDLMEVEENLPPPAKDDFHGTSVEVTSLHSDVAAVLGLVSFENDLVEKIENAHSLTMQQGVVFKVNGKSLTRHLIQLLSSASMRPAFREIRMFEDSASPLIVRLYCGLYEEKSTADSGWHIFCNGRRVVESENTIKTGWGEEGSGDTRIPRWHPQFGRFRGYVFLDCDDAKRMPWNTTKSSIDFNSEVYRRIRLDMVEMMRPVIDFLNKLKDERKENPSDRNRGPLSKLLKQADPTVVSELKLEQGFSYEAPVDNLPRQVNVQYPVLATELELVRQHLGVRSAREVGLETFRYYKTRECP